MDKNSKIYIAGHKGMVGSAILRQLQAQGFDNIVFRDRAQLDLTNQAAVHEFMQTEKPDYVVLAAAKVGGIHANNSYPADFIYENLMIETNIIHQSYLSGCNNLLFLGSSCIYPKSVAQPMAESALLTDTLEATNEPYAIAKISGIKLCESYNRQYGTDYRSAMPTNLYGPFDNFHPENSHVIPALLRRIHEAKINNNPNVNIWGSGEPRREFLHVDDMANACLHIMQLDKAIYQQHTQEMLSHINVGSGLDITIGELANLIKTVCGYQGELTFDTSKPDGTMRKLMDVETLKKLGWQAKIDLHSGLQNTYQWFLDNQQNYRS